MAVQTAYTGNDNKKLWSRYARKPQFVIIKH